MSPVKSILLGAALAGVLASPALAGGWGGRYGAHWERHGESSSYSGEETRDDGYRHEWGGGMSRDVETGDTGWHVRRWEETGPAPGGCYGGGYWVHEAWVNGRLLFHREGRGPGPGPIPAGFCGREVALPGSFFADSGGVGGFGGGYDEGGGGGGGFAFAGSSAHAFASASARASVSVRFHGGGRGHHGGHGCGCGHH
ncbi:MAG TPA: hypothetical protein VG939_17545 [Caulobacteraceae bacterium]|nr:hypothetical protein [Caulobacteraceae bacterium]